MPRVAVLAGINGAGKTTASKEVLTSVLKIPTFVNADIIARGLNGLNPEGVAIRAGRIMLQQLDDLAAAKEDFAFETTLAARTYASWLGDLRVAGYEVYLSTTGSAAPSWRSSGSPRESGAVGTSCSTRPSVNGTRGASRISSNCIASILISGKCSIILMANVI